MNKKWNFNESAEYLHIAHISIMEDQFNVAKVCRKDWGLDAVVEMRKAARLIAAAPEMREVLEEVMEMYVKLVDAQKGSPADKVMKKALSILEKTK